jgi:hypothetical protein
VGSLVFFYCPFALREIQEAEIERTIGSLELRKLCSEPIKTFLRLHADDSSLEIDPPTNRVNSALGGLSAREGSKSRAGGLEKVSVAANQHFLH